MKALTEDKEYKDSWLCRPQGTDKKYLASARDVESTNTRSNTKAERHGLL